MLDCHTPSSSSVEVDLVHHLKSNGDIVGLDYFACYHFYKHPHLAITTVTQGFMTPAGSDMAGLGFVSAERTAQSTKETSC